MRCCCGRMGFNPSFDSGLGKLNLGSGHWVIWGHSFLFDMTLNDPRVMTLSRVKKGQNGAKVDPP